MLYHDSSMRKPDFKHGMALPLMHTADLFQQGSIRLGTQSAIPPYTKRKDERVFLHAKQLRDPAIFTRALQEYTVAIIRPLWERKSEFDFSQDDWHLHMKDSEIALRRMLNVYHEKLTPDNVRKRLLGQSAEFVTSILVQRMVDSFKHDTETIVMLRQWQNRRKEDLGCGYYIAPVQKYNFILKRNAQGGFRQSLGEYDMLVEVGAEAAHILDVSTSSAKIKEKMTNDHALEDAFCTFRHRMMDVFEESCGREGWKDVSKIHCYAGLPRFSPTFATERSENQECVYNVRVGMYHIIEHVAQATHNDLVAGNVLKLGKNDVFEFHGSILR